MNVISARADLLRAAIRCLAAHFAEEHADADAEAEYADEQLALRARDLARETDALPTGKQPAGWADKPVTRLLTGSTNSGSLLLDPDCRDQKHRSCIGDPCECPCHVTGDPGVAP